MFLLQKLNNFVGFKTTGMKILLFHMKRLVAAPTRLVFSRVSFMITQIEVASEEVIRWLASYRGMTVFPQ